MEFLQVVCYFCVSSPVQRLFFVTRQGFADLAPERFPSEIAWTFHSCLSSSLLRTICVFIVQRLFGIVSELCLSIVVPLRLCNFLSRLLAALATSLFDLTLLSTRTWKTASVKCFLHLVALSPARIAIYETSIVFSWLGVAVLRKPLSSLMPKKKCFSDGSAVHMH